jgi:hypothetical protein
MARPSDPDIESRPAPWRPVTRRAFVLALGAALGAVAAPLAFRRGTRWYGAGADDDRPPSRWTGTTRWIGHC